MHEIVHSWNQRQILRRLVPMVAYFENLQKIFRLAGGQIQCLLATRKMTPKIHQKKNQRDLNAWEQPSLDFFSENSNKVPLWNTLRLVFQNFVSNSRLRWKNRVAYKKNVYTPIHLSKSKIVAPFNAWVRSTPLLELRCFVTSADEEYFFICVLI